MARVDLRLDRLHLVLQAALGWTNTHLWEFRVRDIGWGVPDAEWDRGSASLDARKATLLKVLEDTGAKTLIYLYDFGVCLGQAADAVAGWRSRGETGP